MPPKKPKRRKSPLQVLKGGSAQRGSSKANLRIVREKRVLARIKGEVFPIQRKALSATRSAVEAEQDANVLKAILNGGGAFSSLQAKVLEQKAEKILGFYEDAQKHHRDCLSSLRKILNDSSEAQRLGSGLVNHRPERERVIEYMDTIRNLLRPVNTQLRAWRKVLEKTRGLK